MKVGDKVYLVFDDSRKGALHVTIKSIGKKYITVDNMHVSESKYDIVTKQSVDDSRGWNCRATLYESEEDYIKCKNISILRKEMTNKIINTLERNIYNIDTLESIMSILDKA